MPAKLDRRNFLRLSGTLSLGTLLVACAPAPAPTTEGAQGEPSATGETVELSLMMVDYAEPTKAVLEDEIIPAFTREKNVTVNVNYTDWGRYNEQMTTAFASGVTPDVFQGGAVWAPQMAKRGWALPLDDYIALAGDEWNWDDFFPALQDDVTIDGSIVAVPYRIDIRSFWYRQDHMEEAGIAAPPTNWEELREFANALTIRENGKITREGYHFSGPGGWQNDLQAYMQFMEMAGGQFLSDDLTHCTLDEPPAIEALEYVYTLVVEDQVQPYPGFEAQGDLAPIAVGMASSTYDSSFLERDVNLYAPDQLEHLVVTLPLRHKVQACHVWVNKFFISSLTKTPDMAWAFFQHLTSAPMLEKYCASAGVTPPRRSLADAEFMTDRMKVLLTATEYAVPYPKHWRLIELFRPLATNLEKCLRGELSPEETMVATCAEIDAILAEDA
ncbi:extracellular solute-binding protein [Litorilinea aerophila]|uniref:Extracellular solute-binding protein n=1 Tax=Litorilinea aerophila TaxID=1204385 RepID=A0A540VNK3_9CHLR|nr:extracellular solute-binding protein [Litorilinea aerophila]MCC9074959.1 extracellular solute-binding protein [Litorilinea aerophila]